MCIIGEIQAQLVIRKMLFLYICMYICMYVCMYRERDKDRQADKWREERDRMRNENVGSVLTGLGEMSLSGGW